MDSNERSGTTREQPFAWITPEIRRQLSTVIAKDGTTDSVESLAANAVLYVVSVLWELPSDTVLADIPRDLLVEYVVHVAERESLSIGEVHRRLVRTFLFIRRASIAAPRDIPTPKYISSICVSPDEVVTISAAWKERGADDPVNPQRRRPAG